MCRKNQVTNPVVNGEPCKNIAALQVRPDDIIHDDDSTESAKVIDKVFYGSDFLYELELQDKQKVFCYTPSHHNHALNESIGIKPVVDHLMLFEKKL